MDRFRYNNWKEKLCDKDCLKRSFDVMLCFFWTETEDNEESLRVVISRPFHSQKKMPIFEPASKIFHSFIDFIKKINEM